LRHDTLLKARANKHTIHTNIIDSQMPNLDLLVIGDEYRWMYTDSVEIIIWYGLYGYDRPTIGQLLQRRGHKTAR